MVVCFSRNPPQVPPIVLGGTDVERVRQIKLLGLIVTDDLKWQEHSDYLCVSPYTTRLPEDVAQSWC